MSADGAGALTIDALTHTEILTPEGVPITFTIAPAGDRAGAFVLDMLIIILLTLGIYLLAFLGSWATVPLALAIATLASFILWNFYFTFFEIYWQGRTVGKRLCHLRVIDAYGGPLTTDAVFARNLMRMIEVYLPLMALLAPQLLWPGQPATARLVSGVWLFVLACMPLFNRKRMRVGDFVAGTIVVLEPHPVLLGDLAATRKAARDPRAAGLRFTEEQLGEYGIYELQVLEDLLRRKAPDRSAMRAVYEKIRERTGWEPPEGERVDPKAFLRAFYKAQRAHLERRMLFGQRRERKAKRDKREKS